MLDETVRRTFAGVPLDSFWDDSDYALEAYVDRTPSAELVASVEAELGYKLPASYVSLMRSHNGGIPRNTACPAPNPTTWADDHVSVHGILGIGRTRRCSPAGDAGYRLWLEEWEYRTIGV